MNYSSKKLPPRAGRQPEPSEFARLGESNGRAKLTEDDVRLLRRLVAPKPEGAGMSCREVGDKFSVSAMLVSLIVRHKRWVHVK